MGIIFIWKLNRVGIVLINSILNVQIFISIVKTTCHFQHIFKEFLLNLWRKWGFLLFKNSLKMCWKWHVVLTIEDKNIWTFHILLIKTIPTLFNLRMTISPMNYWTFYLMLRIWNWKLNLMHITSSLVYLRLSSY